LRWVSQGDRGGGGKEGGIEKIARG
jgi:hypothetical protein